jgi:tRNA-modifying protein YgfZ
MSDATQTVSVAPLEWSLIRARGEQSSSFLQSQLTQDLEGLGETERWSLLLRPDSVVVTALLVRAVDGGVDLVVPRDLAEDATARLRRFLLRVDCTLEVVEAPEGPFATTAELVAAGWPGVNETSRELSPHSFGSAVFAATISFTKGCYTGQELVGRLDARGAKVPWRLVRANGATFGEVDAVLRSKGPTGPQGVTTAVPDHEGVRALGVAHRTLVDGVVDGVHVTTL